MVRAMTAGLPARRRMLFGEWGSSRIRAIHPAALEAAMFDRRNFLASLAGIAGAVTFPQRLLAELAQAPGKLPDASLYEANEEAYWTELRKQFLIPEDEVWPDPLQMYQQI
jgi:hypothetical protein